tara:strand:- start:873 stop:1535 length:663 start_codon:yes stop_codon:yes gene_type:complete
MKNYIIIGQGSQTIQLIRELFSLNVKPSQLSVITLEDKSNLSFIEFIKYYKLKTSITDKQKFDKVLTKMLKDKIDLVISFSNPFIIDKKHIKNNKIINFHPGLLPSYRGSFSTVHAMIDRQEKTGGTWHYVSEKVDQGDIIDIVEVPITNTSTAFSLNHQVFASGIKDINEVLELVFRDIEGIKQLAKDGKFYKNKFPDLSNIDDKELKQRINYFPPNFL